MAYNEFARLYNNNFTKDSWQRLALNKEMDIHMKKYMIKI